MWVETFWSTDLSGIALKGCMDNFTQYTRQSPVSTYCFFPVHLRERSITQHTNSKQQSLCHESIGVRAGGARGAAAPPKFWATQIFWAARENLGKTSFLTRFRVF